MVDRSYLACMSSLTWLYHPQPIDTASTSIMTIRNNLKRDQPDSKFYVAQFKRPGGYGSFYGKRLIMVQLVDEQWLMALHLQKSLVPPPQMENAIVQQKAFPFVYDTRSIRDPQERANRLAADLKRIFPGYFVHIFVYANAWDDTFDDSGSAAFKREYGSDVRIILT